MSIWSGPVGKSFGLHLLLGGMLVVSMDFHSPPKPQPLSLNQPIEAVVIDQQALEQQLQDIQREKDAKRKAEQRKVQEQQRAKEAERKRKQKEAQARKKKQQEREKAKKLEQERKRKEKERKAAEEKARKAKEKREAEQKARKEAERKRQEAMEKAEQERILQEQLEAERHAQAKRRSQQVLNEVQKHTAIIQSAISQRWIIDQSMKGKYCRLNIRAASNGLVLQVKVLEGDASVCKSAQSAVFKMESLPAHKDPDVFKAFQNFNLTMRPEV